MRPEAGWNSFWSLFLYQRLNINSNTSCAKFLREDLSTCKVKYIVANQTLAWRAECLGGFPLSKRCTSWSKPGKATVLLPAPSTPPSTSQPLLPYWALWLPGFCHPLLPCQVTPCLPSRLPAAGQTAFISWFSITILSDNLTPVAFFWASLLESWAFGSWALSLPHAPSSQGAATLIPVYHSLLCFLLGEHAF